MDLNQLKAELPNLVSAIRDEGMQAGIATERARVSALKNWAKADPLNAKLDAVVEEAIAQGKTDAEVMPQLQVAIRTAAVDTPPPVTTKASTASGAVAVSDDDLVAAATALALGKKEVK